MFCRKQTAPPSVELGCAVSRWDFLDSLRLLGARMSVPHPCAAGAIPGEVQEICLNCPRDVWERVIGPPRNIICHYSPSRHGFHHTWEHHWIGGSVKCFGCLLERAADAHWLVLSRVVFFERSSETQPRCRLARAEVADAMGPKRRYMS